MANERIAWIDWMKVIGMYFIVAGHLFPIGYTYIYIFSVPLFFLISGFLSKKEHSNSIFWKKIFFNYFTPLFIIRSLMYIWEKYISIDPAHFMSIIDYWILMVKGYQNCIGACWFIYTLIIIKILFQYLPYRKVVIVIFILLTGIAIFLNLHNIHKNNAIYNVSVAYQPFAIGYYLRQHKNLLNNYHPTIFTTIAVSFLCIILIFLCGLINGDVWLYSNSYGNSFILYLVGTLCGALFIFLLSKQFETRFVYFIYILSFGNIVTLGFHQIFVNTIRMYLNTSNYLMYLLAFIIILVFFPIIIFCKSHFPILLGIFHPSNKSNNAT